MKSGLLPRRLPRFKLKVLSILECAKMNKVELSVELVNIILSYLGSRPYADVAGIIQRIHEEAGAPQAPVEAPQADE